MLHEEQGYPNDAGAVLVSASAPPHHRLRIAPARVPASTRPPISQRRPGSALPYTTPPQVSRSLVIRCNNRAMIWFLVGLLALTVIVGVWYGAPARRRLLDAETLAATRERDVAEILAATSEAFVSFDAGGAITTWSSNAERLFGWSAPEVMGKSLTDTLIPVHDRPTFDKSLFNRPVGTQSAFIGHRVDTTAL